MSHLRDVLKNDIKQLTLPNVFYNKYRLKKALMKLSLSYTLLRIPAQKIIHILPHKPGDYIVG
jgi:hypothetical protein